MKFELSMDDWMLLDYCIAYTFKHKMYNAYGKENTLSDEELKEASKINELRNKITVQTTKVQIKKDL